MLPDARWVGEVGLDFPPGTGTAEKRRQRAAFDALLGHDQIQSKLLTVHSRGAAREIVTMLAGATCRAVLHWYSGTAGIADEALAAGLWFSANPAMIRSARGRRLIAMIPPERILCETDGPYCRNGSRPAEPADVVAVTDALAATWDTDLDGARQTLADNARAFISGKYP
jgi:TatD DNase family protein